MPPGVRWRWTPDRDAILFRKLLETHKIIPLDGDKIRTAWPKQNLPVPSTRAIKDRLKILGKLTQPRNYQKQPSEETSTPPPEVSSVPEKRQGSRLESPTKKQKGDEGERSVNEPEETQESEEAVDLESVVEETADQAETEVRIKEEPVEEEFAWNSMAGIEGFPVVEPEEMILDEAADGENWTEEQRAAGGF